MPTIVGSQNSYLCVQTQNECLLKIESVCTRQLFHKVIECQWLKQINLSQINK